MGAKLYFLLFLGFMAVIMFQAVQYFEFQDQTEHFVSKGPRFTADDGQTLCERIRALEKEPQPCGYGGK